MLMAGLKQNENLISVNLSYNPMLPEDVNGLANLLLEKRATPCALKVMNFDNIWVKKNFIRIRNRCKKKGFTITYGGIYSNYKIRGPVLKNILLERSKVVAMLPKKKKNKKDIGIFMVTLKDEPIKRSEFIELLHKHKVKLDQDLLEQMLTTWECEKKRINIKDMKECYLKLYPETQLPPKKKKKKKKPKTPTEGAPIVEKPVKNVIKGVAVPQQKEIVQPAESEEKAGTEKPNESSVKLKETNESYIVKSMTEQQISETETKTEDVSQSTEMQPT